MTLAEERPVLRALLVDDHQLLAQSLALALDLEGVACIVAELVDRDSLVEQARRSAPDLVLLDLELGDTLGNGVDLVQPFVEAGCRVLVVSASTDRELVARAVEAGASDVVSKSVAFEHLLEAAVAVARGERVMDPVQRHRMLADLRAHRSRRASERATFARLTERETQVLQALCDGVGVAAFAAASFVSEATVRSQVRGVLTKLGVTSQLEAVALAHRARWRMD
ncbi:response regulator transcription factor [Nocardioides panacis]|uniref:Response regulator transcription factor n=1 Tax=Nocardioides panacis TaxID=2849501 RepID=A0A975Y0Z4_9ACTN|nr:response regulator transcription factor [Nocardioides panacis]QWZ08977.1 response regulator transcription factor [Nocardioides panacis]